MLNASILKLVSKRTSLSKIRLDGFKDEYELFSLKMFTSKTLLNWFLNRIYKAIKYCCHADFLLSLRICLITLYFILHAICLRFNVWSHSAITSPPPPPVLESYLSPVSPHLVNKFAQLAHPHVHGHAHLNVPIVTAIRRSLGLALAEWIILLRLKMVRSSATRSRLFGLLAGILTFVNITGIIFGGLDVKSVLFPDIWDYIDFRLHANHVFPQRSIEQLLMLFGKSFPSVAQTRVSHFLNPNDYLRLDSSPFLKNCHVHFQPLPRFIFPILYILHLLDILGACLYTLVTCLLIQPTDTIIPSLILIIVLMTTSFFVSGVPKPDANDHHWIRFNSSDVASNYKTTNSVPPPVRITKYIKMKDETLIAADIYLPFHIIQGVVCLIRENLYKEYYRSIFRLKGCHTETPLPRQPLQIPTFLMVTRYNRRTTLHWPFTFLSFWGQKRGQPTTNLWSWQFVDSLVVNDYALIVADTRGTGASFGTRPVDLSPMEIYDLASIREWVTNQFWYNGQIATGGFSYDGMTGLYMAATQPVQAVLALFTPINVVHDLIQPGGLVCSSFVEDYTGLTHAFETLGTPRQHLLFDLTYDIPLILGFMFVFGHAAPVKSYESLLPKAFEDHRFNWNMTEMVQSIHFTDDFVIVPASKYIFTKNLTQTYPFSTTRISAKQFGISQHLVHDITSRAVKKNVQSGKEQSAAVYIVGGYCDSSSVRGSVRLYEALRTTRTKYPPTRSQYRLTLGPWTHTGRRNCSPFSPGTYSHFEQDMYLDILRFLDFHLKGKQWVGFSNLNEETSKTIQPEDTSMTLDASPVHFWSLGDEKWFAAEEYPPLNGTEVNYEFSSKLYNIRDNGKNKRMTSRYIKKLDQLFEENSETQSPKKYKQINGSRLSSTPKRNSWTLIMRNPENNEMFHGPLVISNDSVSGSNYVSYNVDYNATTRGMSRWVIAKHAFRMGSYSHRQMYPSPISDYEFSLFGTLLSYFSRSTLPPSNWIPKIPLNPNIYFSRIHMLNKMDVVIMSLLKAAKKRFAQLGSPNITLPFFNISHMLLWIDPTRQSTGDLLTFTSPLLTQSLRIVGSPLVRFSINLTEEFIQRVHELRYDFREQRSRLKVNELDPVPALDVTIFAYIEDVDPVKEKVHYVTEGRILLSHRPTIPDKATKIIDGLKDWRGCASRPLSEKYTKDTVTIRQKPRLGSADLIFQNGDRGSHRFTVGGTECVAFTFEPVTWLFKMGHQIRLTLAGADRGNFQWSRTQSKEDVDLLAQSLLFAVKAGNHEWFNEIQRRPVQVERPINWKIPLNDTQHVAFLKLVVYENHHNIDFTPMCLIKQKKIFRMNKIN